MCFPSYALRLFGLLSRRLLFVHIFPFISHLKIFLSQDPGVSSN
jgi:hypothetical protein